MGGCILYIAFTLKEPRGVYRSAPRVYVVLLNVRFGQQRQDLPGVCVQGDIILPGHLLGDAGSGAARQHLEDRTMRNTGEKSRA